MQTQAENSSVPSVFQDRTKNENIILKGTIIRGDIESDSAITVEGKVVGDISSSDTVSIKDGIVEGNIKASSVYVEKAQIIGDINAEESMMMTEGSIMRGNLITEEASIDGSIKGNITINGVLSLSENAVVIGGDISCKTQIIDKGSVIRGNFIQTDDGKGDADINSIFEKLEPEIKKPVENKGKHYSKTFQSKMETSSYHIPEKDTEEEEFN